jgi:hypothetical protein
MAKENQYVERRAEADLHLDRQMRIIAALFPSDECRLATVDEDRYGIDAFVGNYRIGLRVRFADYPDIAIRHVELRKIKQGRVDYMLYCQTDSDKSEITSWKLIDLTAIRRASEDWYSQAKLKSRTAANGDRFWTIDLAALEIAYGPACVANGKLTTETTKTTSHDGVQSTKRTVIVETSIHPAFKPAA